MHYLHEGKKKWQSPGACCGVLGVHTTPLHRKGPEYSPRGAHVHGAQLLFSVPGSSNQISNVHRHLVDLRGVVLLDVPEDADVIVLHEINGHALSAIPARPSNSVYVQFSVIWQVVVNDQGHLRDIQPPGPDIC